MSKCGAKFPHRLTWEWTKKPVSLLPPLKYDFFETYYLKCSNNFDADCTLPIVPKLTCLEQQRLKYFLFNFVNIFRRKSFKATLNYILLFFYITIRKINFLCIWKFVLCRIYFQLYFELTNFF